MKYDKNILNIVKDKIQREYADDVSLIVLYATKENRDYNNIGIDFYYIPKTAKASKLSTQFIIDGTSYDFFPMSWERLVSNAALDSPQAYLLLDTQVVYYANGEDLMRFNNLVENTKRNLYEDSFNMLYHKSYEFFNEVYIYLYNIDNVAKRILDVRIECSKMLNHIAVCLGYINRQYYNSGNGSSVSIIEESFKLDMLPENYENTVKAIIFSKNIDEANNLVKKLIKDTRNFLTEMLLKTVQKEPFETLFTGYYEELKSILNWFRIAIEKKDYIKMFSLAAYMHEEIAVFMMKTQSGLWYNDRNVYSEYSGYFDEYFSIDLVEAICNQDDKTICERLDNFEAKIIKYMKLKNVEIKEFESIEQFQEYFNNK